MNMNSLEERLQGWFRAPWAIYHKPFEIVDHVYFVGNTWVSAFLLDTDEGAAFRFTLEAAATDT